MNSRVLPILALMFSVAIFFIYIQPTWDGSIATTKAAIAADDQALAAASAYVAQQNALIAARNAIDPADLARLQTFLPNSVDNVGMILDLNALAARSGMTLSNVDISATSNDNGSGNSSNGAVPVSLDPVDSVDLSLSAAGTYAAFQTFLQGVEKSERLIDVRDLLVTGSDTGVYTYKMTLRLYWLR
jgi:Tfp pilus assembly protein PilO